MESARERVVIIVEFRLSALSFSAQQSFSRIFGRTNMRPWKMVADLGTFGGFMLEFTMFIY